MHIQVCVYIENIGENLLINRVFQHRVRQPCFVYLLYSAIFNVRYITALAIRDNPTSLPLINHGNWRKNHKKGRKINMMIEI